MAAESHASLTTTLPPALRYPTGPAESGRQEPAWDAVLAAHSRLLLHTAASLATDYDDKMDRYAFLLEELRKDDFRRLRAYAADGRTKFSTWLVVVARRLLIDYHRARHGRPRTAKPTAEPAGNGAAGRKRLAQLVGAEIDPDHLADDTRPDPDTQLRQRELRTALGAALASLAPHDRLLLSLRFEDGCSAREIAEVVGFPSPFHVYRRLKALLKQLKRTLEHLGVRESAP